MTEDAEEQRLFDDARTGSRQAFAGWVSCTASSVWSLARRLTADEETAEDVLQETYLAAWGALPGFRGDARPRSWLYGIARRQAAKTWRRRAGEPDRHEPLTSLAREAGWGQDPEALAARGEDRARLLRALSTLDVASQDTLTRCDLEGLSPTELAAELGVAPGTVRVRLHRARLRLLAALRPEVCDG